MAMNELVRMHADLDRALAKPMTERSWAMVIDVRKCVGCDACTISCAAENVCPPGTSYRQVFTTEYKDYPELDQFFMPANCQQCEDPPCMKAANKVVNGAIRKRADGIVVFDYSTLAAHRKAGQAAAAACPHYAIVEDQGGYYTENTPKLEPYETRTFYENGRKLSRKQTTGSIRKCTFCVHRLESGMLPACVGTCIGRAMYFGDLRDPQSLVSKLVKTQHPWRVSESLDTGSRVYYIGFAGRTNLAVPTSATCVECHQ